MFRGRSVHFGARAAGPLVCGPLAGRCAPLAAEPAADQQAGRLRSDAPAHSFLNVLLLRVPSFLALAVLLSACYRQQMSVQPKYDPLEPSTLFADGMSARPRVPGTVARGELVADDFLHTGKIAGAEADGFPFPVTDQVMARGQERFNIYCSECHGRVGDGKGMIPSRGYRQPPSFHTETLRAAKSGHYFDVMTNGFGAMPPYGTMVPVNDRWAIVAYIRALQLSQNAAPSDIPESERAKLGGAR